jgi:hypothetical protein
MWGRPPLAVRRAKFDYIRLSDLRSADSRGRLSQHDGQLNLQSQLCQSRMIIRPRPLPPSIKPVLLLDGEIINAGVTALHQSAGIEFPHFISIRAKPLPRRIVGLVSKSHRNSFFIKSPQLFDKAIIEFLRPLSGKESDDLISATDKFVAIAPAAVERVALRNFFRIARVPVILGGPYF